MDGADVLAIEVDSGAVVEGDDGERFLGAGGVVTPAATAPSISLLRTFSDAMIGASAPNWTLPPVWSKWKCVLSTKLRGLSLMLLSASLILGASGAN